MKILLSSKKQILKEYIKDNSLIGFIPTASELDDDRWYMVKDRNDLVNMNYKLIDIDVTNESKEEILKKFDLIDALFVDGGNCFYLLQQLQKKDILSNIIDFTNNKPYIGCSAGSCITCPSIEYLDKLDNKEDAPNVKDYNGLNFINAYILPHYKSDEDYSKLIDDIVKEHKDLNFILLTNEQAIIVEDRNNYKVVNTD